MMLGGQKMLVILYMLYFSIHSHDQQQLESTFILALQWPNSYCNQDTIRCKQPVPQEFKIARFRPFDFTYKRREIRRARISFEEKVKSWNFTNELDLLWPNLTLDGDNTVTWKTEWSENGQRTQLSAENFFYLATKVAESFSNLHQRLKDKRIVIPSNKPYARGFLHRYIAVTISSSPRLNCNKNRNGEDQLLWVSICMNYQGETFDCPTRFYGCKNSSIFFPTEETVLS